MWKTHTNLFRGIRTTGQPLTRKWLRNKLFVLYLRLKFAVVGKSLKGELQRKYKQLKLHRAFPT